MKLEKFIYEILESKSKSMMVYVITLVLFILSVLTFPTEITKAKMLPSKDSDTFSIYVDLKDGSSINQTKEVTQCIVKNLQKEENILNISAFLGEGQPLDFAALVKQSSLKDKESQAEIMINIKKREDRDITSYNLVSQLRKDVQKNCSLYEANIKFIELPAGPPVLASIVTEIYGGNSFESRRDFALKIAKILKNQATLVDIDILADDDFIMYELEIDNSKAIISAIDLEQIKNILFLAFEGMKVSVINDKNAQSQIPIFLRLDDSRTLQNSSKESLKAKLQSLKLMNKNGNMVSISEFVNIKESIKEPTITSKNLNLMINVIAETDKDSQIYPLLDSRSEILETLSNDYEIIKTNMLNLSFIDKKTKERFDLVFDGELKVTIDTFIDLGGAFIIALVLIFFLMVMYYKSFAISGGIVLASFISIVGVIIAHIIMDLITTDTFYLTATSLIGLLGLLE